MDLVAHVRRALETTRLEPTDFERCACALLGSNYSGLSPVEGGHDFGRDADIPLPASPEGLAGWGRLMVTTGDPVANVRNGLERLHEEGLAVDLVVVACSQEVDARKRRALDSLCRARGIDAPHVFGREWFVGRLVQDPYWRHHLLGVRGELGALHRRPLSMIGQQPDLPGLEGRDDEVADVERLIGNGQDVVMTGFPGVGKTRLAAELHREVFFYHPVDTTALVDDLLLTRPAAVVVDDAHAHEEHLQQLRRARDQESLAFSIIATTWPDRADDVGRALPGAALVTIPLLELSSMDRIVRSAGVIGHRARRLVLQQAEGRPGWALTLCALFKDGRGLDVVTGRAHADSVEAFLRRTVDSAEVLDALACIAVLGRVDAGATHQLAGLVGVNPAVLGELLERAAHHGLLDWDGAHRLDPSEGAWSLQPALRAPLVARWFFGERPRRLWSTIEAVFPDRARDLVHARVDAAHTGARAAECSLDAWFTSLPDPSRWDEAVLTLVGERAALSESAAREAVAGALVALVSPRESVTILGHDIDMVGQAAIAVLHDAARRWVLPEAVRALLDLAASDDRPRGQTPDHPLRVLGDVARQVDPDHGTEVGTRRDLLAIAVGWMSPPEERTTEQRWSVFTELAAVLLSPEVSGSWTDPGSPSTLTFLNGVDTAEHLEQLVDLWPSVLAVLAVAPDDHGCPPIASVKLLDLVHEWFRLGAGFAFGRGETSQDQRDVGARGAEVMLASLREHVQAVPGLALRAQHMLGLVDRGPENGHGVEPFDVDPDLAALLTIHVRDRGQDVHALVDEQEKAHEDLAGRIATMSPREGVRWFEELVTQARLAVDDESGFLVARLIGPLVTDPRAWLDVAIAAGNPGLVHPCLLRCLSDGVALPGSALDTLLTDPHLRGAAITAVLERHEVDAITRKVVDNLGPGDAWLLDRCFVREADEVMHLLLHHLDPVVAGTTAVGFGVGGAHGPSLPDEWRPQWRLVVLALHPGDLPRHSRWRAEELLEHLVDEDPDLLVRWYLDRLGDDRSPISSWAQDGGAERHLARLSSERRERLARRCLDVGRVVLTPLVHLVGEDGDLAGRLLEQGALSTEDLVEVLRGHRDDVLETLGPLLLDRGVEPAEIARSAGWVSSWTGPRSAAHAAVHAWFAALEDRVPALAAVAIAGCQQQAVHQRDREQEERAARVRAR